MFTLFFTGFINTILHYTLTFNTDVDKFIYMFLLIDLLIASVACIIRTIDKYYNIVQNLIDQLNQRLAERDKIIDNIRKVFAFQKLKSSYFSMMYFKALNLKNQINKVQQDLITFGLDEQIAKDEQKLFQFVQQFGADKYQVKVNQKDKKFIFIRKEEDDTNSTKS